MTGSGASGNSPSFLPLDDIETTSETLTDRAGLSLFSRYLRNIGIYDELEGPFSSLRKTAKGQPVDTLFHQLFCFFLDGTSPHLVRFDELKQEEGYAAAIETAPEAMASSHMMKRFLYAFDRDHGEDFRELLQQLFVWRLQLEDPDVLVFGIDTMVMDNDEAEKREGVEPTYKKVKGFQPLQITWGPFIVDAMFRSGSKHSNHGDAAPRMLRGLVDLVREHYDAEIPILFAADSGFFDQKIFDVLEELGVGYVVTGGKLYDEVKQVVEASAPEAWISHENGDQVWDLLELGDRRKSWDRIRRVLFSRPRCDSDGLQRLLRFRRPEITIYTNLGLGDGIDEHLREAGLESWLEPERIVELHHARGRDELVHRAIKDFRDQRLPFHRFLPNTAFYYTTLLAFNLYEAFKQDGLEPAVPITSYATRVRRQVIDIAGKIVEHSHRVTLKITEATFDRLDFQTLWDRVSDPPRFCWA